VGTRPAGAPKRRTSEVETVQNPAFWRWAIQDSNLGSLPYKQAMKAADKLMLAVEVERDDLMRA
jgi:hypothetical protein